MTDFKIKPLSELPDGLDRPIAIVTSKTPLDWREINIAFWGMNNSRFFAIDKNNEDCELALKNFKGWLYADTFDGLDDQEIRMQLCLWNDIDHPDLKLRRCPKCARAFKQIECYWCGGQTVEDPSLDTFIDKNTSPIPRDRAIQIRNIQGALYTVWSECDRVSKEDVGMFRNQYNVLNFEDQFTHWRDLG